jgi:hypothetical protein
VMASYILPRVNINYSCSCFGSLRRA